ncbi:MAG: hypothetical protein QOG52_908, partial [Frankiaceae bacterium]|nr:hypothetical protein [Frankiaceae bacterium]
AAAVPGVGDAAKGARMARKAGEQLVKHADDAADARRAIHSRYPDGTPVYKGEQPPRLPTGPDPAATGAHSRIRWDETNNRVYQSRQFDAEGHPQMDIDMTHPTYPSGKLRPDHTAPEYHRWTVNDPAVGPRSGFRREPGQPTRPEGL